ncbi:hypothetical protein BJ170DRAFT_720571 [Xylariales sp. AK1849]|nr:hypothetical protein BJ170DRAFT_720571 [Xylariales sp. AK1849]
MEIGEIATMNEVCRCEGGPNCHTCKYCTQLQRCANWSINDLHRHRKPSDETRNGPLCDVCLESGNDHTPQRPTAVTFPRLDVGKTAKAQMSWMAFGETPRLHRQLVHRRPYFHELNEPQKSKTEKVKQAEEGELTWADFEKAKKSQKPCSVWGKITQTVSVFQWKPRPELYELQNMAKSFEPSKMDSAAAESITSPDVDPVFIVGEDEA